MSHDVDSGEFFHGVRVVYVKSGVANLLDDCIELHQDLVFPEWVVLKEWLLHHELGHKENLYGGIQGLKWDSIHDFADQKHLFLLFRFMWNRPSTWWQLWPVSINWEKKTVYVAWSHIVVWIFLFLATGLIIFLFKTYFFDGGSLV